MSSNTSSLGALVWCGLGQKGEEEEGFKMAKVVLAFALG